MRRPLPWLAAAIALGCGPRSCDRPREEVKGEDAEAPVAATAAAAPVRPVLLDAADAKSACVFGYRGAVLDLGGRDDRSRFGPKLAPPPVDWVEREGARWAEVQGKTLSVDFLVVPPADEAAEAPAGSVPFVEARVRGGSARGASFYLNRHAIGGVTLARGVTRVVTLKGAGAQVLPGRNELTIRLIGVPKASTDPSIEIDWVHFGVGEPDPQYAAPTWRDTLVSRTFAGQPGRALSLRGPGFARCEGWLPHGGVVEARARLEGTGSADAVVRVIRDRTPPTVIGTLHLDAADAADARAHSWPIGDIDAPGTLGAVELSVVRASKGARVVFGEPRVLGPPDAVAPSPKTRTAGRGVVLFVMSELGVRSVPAYGGSLVTPAISSLAASGVVFDASRATTGVAGGAVGSMLTGLPARDLSLTDGESRLPHGVTTIGEAAGQAGIASALFTANPLTSAAFGFDRGWSHFEAHGPTEDAPATKVFDAAVTWLEEHRAAPFLLVIHARGGHPPWDVPPERVKTLPPLDYTGALDARHAGELLGRSARTSLAGRFEDADRARAWALYGAAMESEDGGVDRVVGALRAAGLEESTTFIVTGDVGVNEAARVPLAESDSLDEASLATPLIVRWAHDPARGARVGAESSGEDIATTVLSALGLPPPASFRGRDLFVLADNRASAAPRASLAADQDRFALRWGPFVSIGLRDHETKLCDLSLEPACVTDVRESYAIASHLLHRTLFDRLVGAPPPFPREPASLDAATLADLKMWGR
jgi:arylsulfatase A-like enzyme